MSTTATTDEFKTSSSSQSHGSVLTDPSRPSNKTNSRQCPLRAATAQSYVHDNVFARILYGASGTESVQQRIDRLDGDTDSLVDVIQGTRKL